MPLNQVLDEQLLQKVSIPGSEFCLYQLKGSHGITSDTAFLVDYVIRSFPASESLSMLDIGTGNGIIPIMLKHHDHLWNIKGIEIQEKLYQLAVLNIHLFNQTGISGIELIHQDLREYHEHHFDVLVCNPPYFTNQQYRVSPIKEKAISRHEICLNMTDIFQFFAQQKSENSRMIILYPEPRRNEVYDKIKAYQMTLIHECPLNQIINNHTIYLFDIAHTGNKSS